MGEGDSRCDAGHGAVLHGVEEIRQRPGMYVGSVGERGLHQAVFEVVGRAVTEVLAGRARSVEVTLTADGGVRVVDDGPGVPFEDGGDAGGLGGLESLLTRVHVGARPVGRDTVVVGLGDIGPGVANALSSRMTAEVRRDGVLWVQRYERGVAVAPPGAVGQTSGSGTSIAFWPDPDIFTTVRCSFAVLAERFRELAFLNRGLGISLADARHPREPRAVRFLGEVRDFVALLEDPAAYGGSAGTGVSARTPPVHPDVIAFAWEDPRMAGTAEVALRWCTSSEERVRGFANSAPTPGGGTHLAGFRDGVTAAVNTCARERRLLKPTEPDLGADRVCAGLTAVVSVKLDRPEFEGPTRGVLGNAAVRASFAEAVREHLGGWLARHPEQAEAVVGRILPGGRDLAEGSGPR
ncbi:DNA gyrase subunit B [Streptomyces alboflavus]|uniref:DNA gyrase subunit B n=1 Tax=Streptomyces alboflavus TaxID=67267 RepID=UPI0036C2B902